MVIQVHKESEKCGHSVHSPKLNHVNSVVPLLDSFHLFEFLAINKSESDLIPKLFIELTPHGSVELGQPFIKGIE